LSSNLASGTPAFQPEYIWSYEAGIKTDLFDHRVRLNGQHPSQITPTSTSVPTKGMLVSAV
jgi:hypothetical protein